MRFSKSACHSYGDIQVYCLNLSQCRQQRGNMDLDAADIAKQNKTYHKTQNMGVRKMNVTVLHAIQTPQ